MVQTADNKEGKGLRVIFPSDMRSYCIVFMHGSNVTMWVIVAYLGIVGTRVLEMRELLNSIQPRG
ncbi:hypothetical protein Scep_013643 [Stephania cephalantha]|uniref:Transmembrane protein n=1 Tax=Stephania cephalantha TaxID=152367 RepID=A0AAP0JJI3_9MAGN